MTTQESTAVTDSNRAAVPGTHHRLVRALASIERYLWGVVVAVLVADVVLTSHGLRNGLSEGNPAMRIAIEGAGIAALVGAKLLVVGVGAGVRRFLDDRGAVVPLGLAIPWFSAAVINAGLVL